MKRIFFIYMALAAVAAVAVLLVACQKEGVPEEPTDIYEQIGKLHNEGLELFITKVEKTNLTKSTAQPLSIEEYDKIRDEVSAEMVAKLYGVTLDNSIVKNMVAIPIVIDPLTKSNSELDGLFTKNVSDFLSRLKVLLQTKTETRFLTDAIRHLEKSMVVKCTDEEMEIIRITAAVCIYSAQYWEKNYDRWGDVLLGMDQAQMSQVMTKRSPEEVNLDGIIISDGIGAAAGAIKGGMVGAAGGTVVVPGVGTAGGVLVGAIGGGLSGAIGSSIAAGIGNWINSWFD